MVVGAAIIAGGRLLAAQRGDALAHAQVQKDLAEHAALFRESIIRNKEMSLTRETQSALRQVEGPLARYIGLAEEIVTLAPRSWLSSSASGGCGPGGRAPRARV